MPKKGRIFKITNEQYQRLHEVEDKTTVIMPDNKTKEQAIDDINKNKANFQAKNDSTAATPNSGLVTTPTVTTENCSRIITKKQLDENRLKVLKRNSKLYSVKDFLK